MLNLLLDIQRSCNQNCDMLIIAYDMTKFVVKHEDVNINIMTPSVMLFSLCIIKLEFKLQQRPL